MGDVEGATRLRPEPAPEVVLDRGHIARQPEIQGIAGAADDLKTALFREPTRDEMRSETIDGVEESSYDNRSERSP